MPRIRGNGQFGRPTYSQSAKIIKKFGGENAIARILGISRITAYRWGYAKPYGTDGLIPAHMLNRINSVARLEGILLLPADWLPEKIQYTPREEVHIESMQAKSLAEMLS